MKIYIDQNGIGSLHDIEEYIRAVLENRTKVNDDTSAEALAHRIAISVLNRLKINWNNSDDD